jgi:serine/threonine protein kinase
MDTATARPTAFHRAVFEDGLGTRHHADGPGGEPLEVLELHDQFNTDAFERALRERLAALSGFHSTWFSQVRTVQRVTQHASKLFVVSDRIAGARLSTILSASPQPIDANATVCLIRQLVAGVALLHEKLPNIAHGAIAAERVIITPKARLVISDYVLGEALEELRYSPDQYWNELHVPLPNELRPTFDQRADVMQIGILALELILGRRVDRDDYPVRIHDLTERAWAQSAEGSGKPLPPELRTWLLRMLQLESEQAFASAVDAWEELEHVLIGSDNRASFLALEAVVTDFIKKGPTFAPAKPVPVARPVLVSPNRSIETTPTPEPVDEVATTSSEPVRESPAVTPPVVSTFTPVTAPISEEEDNDVKEPVRSSVGRWIAAAAILAVVVGGSAFFGRQYFMPSAAAEAPGTLVVTTNPPGFQVFIDGQPRGATPLTVELAAGSHELKLATEGEPRIIPVTITPGSTVSQTLELPKAAPRLGQLTIRTEPAGARVSVDGVANGTTPVTVANLEPGTHRVTLENEVGSLTQEVVVEAGVTASLVVPMSMTPAQGIPVSGWIAVDAPAEVQIFEDGRLLGSSESDRVMVTAGKHAFEFVNETLGYRSTRTVTVAAGKVSSLRLEWPKGSLALNAQPWADVWIGGERIGETPIGSVTLPIGTHEIVFRHPELGEQVVRATVTATNINRVSVDMRKR